MKQLIKMFLVSIIAMTPVFGFIVFEVSAAPLSLTKSQCESLPGEWISKTTKTCNVTSSNATVTQSYTIDDKQSLKIADTGSLTIKNGGSLTIKDGGSLINTHTLKNNGKLLIRYGGTLENNDPGVLTIDNGGILDNRGKLSNTGTINSSNVLFIQNKGSLTNNGTLDNSGDLTISDPSLKGGSLINNSTFDNSGALTIKELGSLIIDHSTLNNKGPLTIENGGSLTVDGPSSIGSTLTFTNYNFEMGNFTGWTTVNGGNGGWLINDGTYPRTIDDATTPPLAGSFSALVDQGGPGTYILYHDIALPDDLSGPVTLSWIDQWKNHASGGFVESYQEFRVELYSPGGTPFLGELFSTNPGDPLVSGPTTRNVDITSLVGPYAGQSIRVQFVAYVYSYYFNVQVDDVQVVRAGPSIINTAHLINEGDLYSSGFILNDNYLYNEGTLTNEPSGFLANTSTGTFYNLKPTGHLVNEYGGSLINEDGGTFFNFNIFENEGDFENQGQVNPAISGPITLTPAHHEPIIILTITNNGTLANTGVLNNTGILNNNYEFDNVGSLTNAGSLINKGIFRNTTNQTITGTVTNQGVWTNYFYLYNDGPFTNPGVIYNCNGVITGTVEISGNPEEPCINNVFLPVVLK